MSPEEVAQVQDALRRCLAPAFRLTDGRVWMTVHPKDREELGEALLPMPEADQFKVVDSFGVERGFVEVAADGKPSIRLPSAPTEASDGAD